MWLHRTVLDPSWVVTIHVPSSTTFELYYLSKILDFEFKINQSIGTSDKELCLKQCVQEMDFSTIIYIILFILIASLL
jgi:hypothetical protein